MKFSHRLCSPLFLIALASSPALAQNSWLPYGPYGGDARAFASDPHDHNHIYLGTLSGTIYDSHDGGSSWKRLAQPGKRDDLAFDNIVVDPSDAKHILAGAWVLDHVDGGLYISNDGGHTWTPSPQLKGHSIRSFSVAPSNPKIMVIGALDGVYRTEDAGNTWKLISPEGSRELHEVESIAIDPKNPEIIYAGTWHLPWKTVDGGAHWTNMKEGIIDDSDVFSIIVDPSNAQNVYLSACSGIYRSGDQGTKFTKVQGIPSTARRTRVLMEDSKQTNTVFAGTTEGLWKTTDAGHTFLRNGDPSWIINDVNIDPENSNRVLLATDRNGVLLSTDGGVSFHPSNTGFTSRQITSVVQDRSNNANLYVGVINDKTAGGVFSSTDGGMNWMQRSNGLNGADIFSISQAPDGTVLAGTRHGIYRMSGDNWAQSGMTNALPPEEKPAAAPAAKTRTAKGAAKRPAAPVRKPIVKIPPPQELDASVYAMVATDSATFAATGVGLISSTDNGHTWNHIRTATGTPWRMAAAQGQRVALADLHAVSLSSDGGTTFHAIQPPTELTYITSIAVDDGGRIWLGGREGIWVSENEGAAWHAQAGLFVPNVSGIYFDKATSRVLVTSNQPNTIVFSVHTPDMKVTYNDAGWVLRGARPVGDHLLGITPFEGIVLQPRMVDSATVSAPKRK